MSILELYRDAIKPMPIEDRLRLASLILEDLPERSMVDYCDQWNDEDLRDFAAGTWRGKREPFLKLF